MAATVTSTSDVSQEQPPHALLTRDDDCLLETLRHAQLDETDSRLRLGDSAPNHIRRMRPAVACAQSSVRTPPVSATSWDAGNLVSAGATGGTAIVMMGTW